MDSSGQSRFGASGAGTPGSAGRPVSPGRSTRSPGGSMKKYEYPGRRPPMRRPRTPRTGSVRFEDSGLAQDEGSPSSPRPDLESGNASGVSSFEAVLRGKTAMTDEDDEVPLYKPERYLHIAQVTTVVDKFKVNRRGYKGLLTFCVFAALYFIVMHQQRNNIHIGMENRALRMPLQLKKPNGKVTTVPQFWSFLSGTVVPYITDGNKWMAHLKPTIGNNKTLPQYIVDEPVTMAGYNVMQHSSVVGGIAIYQTRSKEKKCPVNMFTPPPQIKQRCYEEEETDKPFEIKGTATSPSGQSRELSVTVPYDKIAEKYMVLIPSTAGVAEISALIDFYVSASLIDEATRSIEVRLPMFNGNTDVIGILQWNIENDLSGHFSAELTCSSIPYYLYDPVLWRKQAIVEVLLLLWTSFMIKNLLMSYLRTWPLPDIIRHWKVNEPDNSPMPADASGRTRMPVPILIYGSIVLEVFLWLALNVQWYKMQQQTAFDMDKSIDLYGVDSQKDLFNLDHEAKHFQRDVAPLFDMIDGLHSLWDWYFFCASVTTVAFIFRIFEFLDFQGKLNAITQTFSQGVGELFHLLIVLQVVVTGFSFLGYVLFGSQVYAYASFRSAFVSTWQSCFGLFKLKPAQIKYQNPLAGYLYEFLFRMLIVMLLLKAAVAIIFEAYKSVAIKTRKTAPTVPADLNRLWFHTKNHLQGGDGYIPPGLVSTFMHHSNTRMETGEDGVLRERVIITEEELPKLLKKVLRKEIPDLTDSKIYVKSDWLLERYGRIRCVYNYFGEMSEEDIAAVRKIFDMYDLDQSGSIACSEFALALTKLKHPLSQDVDYVTRSMKVVDVDESGEIEWEEFLMYCAHEAGRTVPDRHLPQSMIDMRAEIRSRYQSLKEDTLNDTAGSIWDSKDTMSKKPENVPEKKPLVSARDVKEDNTNYANDPNWIQSAPTSSRPKSSIQGVEEMIVSLQKYARVQYKMVKDVQHMVDPGTFVS